MSGMTGNKLYHCHEGPWGGNKIYLTTPRTLIFTIRGYTGRYVPYNQLNCNCVYWESHMELHKPANFLDEVKRCAAATIELGPVLETLVSESKAMKTVTNRHGHGFSIERYRRHFQHLGGVEIPGTSEWVLVRVEQWSTTKLFDIIDSAYDVKEPSMPIPGDIDE